MRKYVVGYDTEKGFVVLYETDSAKVALTMKKMYTKKNIHEIKIKKRLDR